MEALDLTADRLRRIREAGAKMVNDSRARADHRTAPADADEVRPVRRDDQQAHRPQQPALHRGREAGH